MRGAWQLKDLKGPVELYTDVFADIYVDCTTGKEYVRGERKLFECGVEKIPLPELVENTGNFKFLLNDNNAPLNWSAQDSLKEIMVQGLLKK